MIITLKGATFTNKIGTLNAWSIQTVVRGGVLTSSPSITSIKKDDTAGLVLEYFYDTTKYTHSTVTIISNENSVGYYNGFPELGKIQVTIPAGNTLSAKVVVTINLTAVVSDEIGDDNDDGYNSIYTFTIHPTPITATVNLSATERLSPSDYPPVSGTGITSIDVAGGTEVYWSVSADGYRLQTGYYIVNNDYIKTVVLESISEETDAWEIYSQDGAATVATDENGVPTVTGTQYKATVLMKNTNSDFRFIAPAASAADGDRMVIIGRYGNNVLAFRPRGASVGTNLQRYDYTTFGGAVLTTDASAVNTFAAGDTVEVVWSGNTASLYVNDTLQSSFDCSSYMSSETWQKCAGFMYTNLPNTTFTLDNFILL